MSQDSILKKLIEMTDVIVLNKTFKCHSSAIALAHELQDKIGFFI
jgi:hypothetical protein